MKNKYKAHSEILENTLKIIYPTIILYGIYIIISGVDLPGGGFQGGAVLVAIFISRYLVYPESLKRTEFLKKLDKIVFIFIVTLISLFFLLFLNQQFSELARIYYVLLGVLIGIKVTCGLSVIFFTFITLEGHDIGEEL